MGLADFRKQIEKKYKDSDLVLDYNRQVVGISSGSEVLDSICGGFGLALQGRLVEISGRESSGKTTICLQTTREALRQGYNVIFLDFEQTFDYNYARALGIDTENKEQFLCIQPYTLEDGLSVLRDLEKMVESQKNDSIGKYVIIIDSVAQAKPKELLESAGEQNRIALHASRFGEFAGYLNAVWAGKYKAFILLTNQVRSYIASGNPYATKAVKSSGVGYGVGDETLSTTGGQQLRYLLSLRVMLDYAGKIESGDFKDGTLEREGNYTNAYVIKNKVAPPFKRAKIAIMYGKGTDDTLTIIEALKKADFISSAGAVFTYIDSKDNEVGEGLSFKIKGKNAFYDKLAEDAYKKDMLETFKILQSNTQKIELASKDSEEEL